MGYPFPDVLHGDPCDCTLHDLGLGCRPTLSQAGLDRELGDLVSAAFRSGLTAAVVSQACQRAVEHQFREQSAVCPDRRLMEGELIEVFKAVDSACSALSRLDRVWHDDDIRDLAAQAQALLLSVQAKSKERITK
jgi:hypothetical protein